jgi:hypothetical protein
LLTGELLLSVDSDPPTVRVGGLIWEHGLSGVQARELAAVMIECADELDSARPGRSSRLHESRPKSARHPGGPLVEYVDAPLPSVESSREETLVSASSRRLPVFCLWSCRRGLSCLLSRFVRGG